MADLKISVITVSYNAADTIERCIRSVISQKYDNIEHIVIDGASDDGTIDIIDTYKDKLAIAISETDKGLYDAMNKGIGLATGDIIGMLNADDFYAGEDVLARIAEAFVQKDISALYGDIDYINQNGKIIRKWRAGLYRNGMFNYGWMPPHPAFYCKRELYEQLGNYSLNYGTAADYELMLRFIHVNRCAVYYVPQVLVKMLAGGVSNSSLGNRIRSLRHDYRAMRNNHINMPLIALLLKPLSKLKQFF